MYPPSKYESSPGAGCLGDGMALNPRPSSMAPRLRTPVRSSSPEIPSSSDRVRTLVFSAE